MKEAFHGLLSEGEKSTRHDVLATVVLLQNPLSVTGIASLLDNEEARHDLSPFNSVIHLPSTDHDHVNIFHASFREFILDTDRCEAHAVDYTRGHQMLTIKCLQLLNNSLRRNICNLPKDGIGRLPHEIKDPGMISTSLRYSCVYWAFHLLEALSPREPSTILECVSEFADTHLLHWFECLSAIGELESGVRSLRNAKEATLVSAPCGEAYQLTTLTEIPDDIQ